MPIFPLPQFEADLAEYRLEKEAYERLSVPKTVVVRFGVMKMIGEFPFDLNVKPGCGTKMIVRSHRGTELAEMLTSTCPNAGCSKSVTRKEMLEYIENSGGKDYPYFNDGKVLRIATTDDLNEQRRIDGLRQGMKREAQARADEAGVPMKIVDAEPILGGERLTFYFTAEDRVDFRDLVGRLSEAFSTRIELRQVGARDEARLIADYEKCGQHCCCKQFLKVLKPISMKSAKIQKATLDPLKISGRCGRLMCCLRYEDETYDTLRKRLPRMKSRVTTPDGPGTVMDAQILTQLVLVQLDSTGKRAAFPVENITLGGPPAPPEPQERERSGSDRPQREPRGPADSRDPRDAREPRDRRDSRAPRENRHPRDPRDRRDPRGRSAPGAPEPNAPTPTDDASAAVDDPLRGLSEEEVARRAGLSDSGAPAPRAPSPRGDDRQREYRERSRREDAGRGPAGPRPTRGTGPQGGSNRPPRPPGPPAPPRTENNRPGRDAGAAPIQPGEGDADPGSPETPETPGAPGTPNTGDGQRRGRRRRRGGRGGRRGGGGGGEGGGGGSPRNPPSPAE